MRKKESDGVRKGAWSREEDELLKKCIQKYGEGKWSSVPSRAGLKRCRKSCRLRWLNYLSPAIHRGKFKDDEIDLIFRLHKLLGNRWSLIAGRIPGRTANDIKNFWNTHLSKKKLTTHEFPKNQDKVGSSIHHHRVQLKETTEDEDDTYRKGKIEAIYKPQPKRHSSSEAWNKAVMVQPEESTAMANETNECLLTDLMKENSDNPVSLDYEFDMTDQALLLDAFNDWEELLNS